MEEKEKQIPISEYKRLKKIYAEELKRKDETIEELKKENQVLLQTALKESENKTRMNEEIEKLRKSMHKKTTKE